MVELVELELQEEVVAEEEEEGAVEVTTCSACPSTAQTRWGTVRAEGGPSRPGAPSTPTSLTDSGHSWRR